MKQTLQESFISVHVSCAGGTTGGRLAVCAALLVCSELGLAAYFSLTQNRPRPRGRLKRLKVGAPDRQSVE